MCMLDQIRTLVALLYERALKPWAYGYLYNYEKLACLYPAAPSVRGVFLEKAMRLRGSSNWFSAKQYSVASRTKKTKHYRRCGVFLEVKPTSTMLKEIQVVRIHTRDIVGYIDIALITW